MRKVVGLIVAAGLIAVSPPSWSSDPIVATHNEITVIDGDTIQIGGTVYQLAGIDAPELGQACDHDGRLSLCGLAAAYSLRKQIKLEALPIRCFVQYKPKSMPLAACLIGDEEISVNLLKGGYVVALPDAPPHYGAAEHGAKQASLGIWGTDFILPWEWRAGKRLPNEPEFNETSDPLFEFPWQEMDDNSLHLKSGDSACMVKGAITAKGQHFYYSPLDREYDSIAIDLKKGERFFCSDDEARQAGWIRKGESPAKKE